MLDAAGVWDTLPEPACPILDIRVSDGRLGRPASPLFLHFHHRDAGESGFPYGKWRAVMLDFSGHEALLA